VAFGIFLPHVFDLDDAVGVAVGVEGGADDGVFVAAAIMAPKINPSPSRAD